MRRPDMPDIPETTLGRMQRLPRRRSRCRPDRANIRHPPTLKAWLSAHIDHQKTMTLQFTAQRSAPAADREPSQAVLSAPAPDSPDGSFADSCSSRVLCLSQLIRTQGGRCDKTGVSPKEWLTEYAYQD